MHLIHHVVHMYIKNTKNNQKKKREKKFFKKRKEKKKGFSKKKSFGLRALGLQIISIH